MGRGRDTAAWLAKSVHWRRWTPEPAPLSEPDFFVWERENAVYSSYPLMGVSGVMTLIPTLASIGRATSPWPGLRVC